MPGECSNRTSVTSWTRSGTRRRMTAVASGGLLLQRAKEIEGQRLAGEQVGPQTLDVDDGADLAVGDLVVDERDERRGRSG